MENNNNINSYDSIRDHRLCCYIIRSLPVAQTEDELIRSFDVSVLSINITIFFSRNSELVKMSVRNLIKLIGTAVAKPRRAQCDMYGEFFFCLFFCINAFVDC